MFKCLDCGEVFSEPSCYEEHYPYGMGYATQTFSCCPFCEGTVEKAMQCKICGNYFSDEELNYLGICEECVEYEIE